MYIASYYSKNITVFDTSGNYQRHFYTGSGNSLNDLFVYKDKIYVAKGQTTVKVYSLNGTFEFDIVDDFNYPTNVIVLDDNNLIVSDPNNFRTNVYDIEGGFIKTFNNTKWALTISNEQEILLDQTSAIGKYSICLSGCTDPSAHNYNPDAEIDDGSCETCSDGIQNGDETGVDCGGVLCDPCISLVAMFNFDGTASDGSQYQNDGNPINTVPAINRHCVQNAAFYFDGTASVEVADISAYDFTYPASIIAWIKPEDVSNGGIIQQWGPGGAGLDAFTFYLSGGKLNARFSNGSGPGHVIVSSSSTLDTDSWYQVGFSCTGDTVSIYINGVEDVRQGVSVQQHNTTQPLIIGLENIAYSVDNYFEGIIDDVQWYKGILSASEFNNLYIAEYPICPTSDTLILSRNTITPADTIEFTYNIAALGSSNILNFGDGSQMTITQTSGSVAHTYQHEGVYRPRIIIDGVTIAQKSLLAKSCKWISYVTSTGGYREDNEDFCQTVNNGLGYVDPSLTPKSYYWTSFANYNDFSAVGDAVSIEARVKDPSSEGGISCYDTQVAIFGKNGNAWVSYMATGCSYYSSMGAAETSVSGSSTNLNAITGDLSVWRNIKLEVKDDTVKTYFDGDLRYSLPYTGDVGNILGMKVYFKGSGSIDWVKLYDYNGILIYEEEFILCECEECDENLVIAQNPIPAGEYLAGNAITSTGKVAPGSAVIFDATNSIHLPPSFEVEQGAIFEALTGVGCPSTWTCGDVLLYGGQEYNSVQIGTQCWMAENLNIGTMINGGSEQTDNSIIEKYCYDNDTSKCDTYGGLYQWDEMMQYTTTVGTQGVCPNGWHLPADNELKTLEMHLGMSQAQTDAQYWRGTDEGSELAGNELLWTNGDLDMNAAFGTSGFAFLPGGFRKTDGTFLSDTDSAYFWSSSVSGSTAWYRTLNYLFTQIHRYNNNKANGFGVRCVKD